MVDEKQILDLLEPLFKQYSEERNKDEKFGDFVIRKGIISPAKEISVVK